MKKHARFGFWLGAMLFAPLALGAGAATDAAAPTSSVAGNPSFKPAAAGRFELKGVLISSSSRSALVNGRFMREGERIDGAQIVAIGEKSVRVRVGSQHYDILVGSRTLLPLHMAGGARAPVERKVTPRKPSPPLANRVAEANAPQPLRPRQHRVASGESLSIIASRYRYDGVSREQLMMALFRANPEAFGGNINVLRAGSVLRMPDAAELPRMPQATASAAVAAQMSIWRAAAEPARAETPTPSTYGPVRPGETLSAIAARLQPDGASGASTLEQRMLALFDANPQAFNDNINLLQAGATLRIPQLADITQRDAVSAAAEVQEHMARWRDQDRRPPLPTPVQVAAVANSN